MYTKVDELIWSDEKIKTLSDDAKLLFLYVLTTPHRNILGIFKLPIPYGAFDLEWLPERFTKGLDELLSKGFINYDYNSFIIHIKNYLKFNPLENPNQVKGAINALKSILPNDFDKDLYETLSQLNKPFIKPLLEQLEQRLGKSVTVTVAVTVNETVTGAVDETQNPPSENNLSQHICEKCIMNKNDCFIRNVREIKDKCGSFKPYE